MRIGIDARSLESNPAGIGRYIHELSKCLDVLLPDAEFFLYSRRPIAIKKISSRWTHRSEPLGVMRALRSIPWQILRSGRLCVRDHLDFYWAAASFLPALPSNVRTVLTVHDLNHLLVPQTMPFLTLQAYRLYFRRHLMRATYIMSNSQGTASRLRTTYGITADVIVRPAVSSLFAVPSSRSIENVLRMLKVRQPYILGLGTLEPRKNLSRLEAGFSELKSRGELAGYQLVLVGAQGWGVQNDLETGVDQRWRQDIVRLGYVDDHNLPALYGASAAFVFPSLYEGFGIPVAEAMACGAKVVTTDIPELREASRNEAIYVNIDTESIKAGIMQAISNQKTTSSGLITSWRLEAEKLAHIFTAESDFR